MPTYLSLFTYAPHATAEMVDQGFDRPEAVSSALARVGGTMRTFHWMLGDYDGFVVFEVPDEAAAAAFGLAVASGGGVSSHRTFQLLDSSDAERALAAAREIIPEYRPPGAGADWRVGYDALGG